MWFSILLDLIEDKNDKMFHILKNIGRFSLFRGFKNGSKMVEGS